MRTWIRQPKTDSKGVWILAAVLAGAIVAAPRPSTAGRDLKGCCACLAEGGMAACPASGFVCFTDLDGCGAKCEALGCPSVSATIDAVCGEDSYASCEVINPGPGTPAPLLSPVALAFLCLSIFALTVWRARTRGRA